MQPSTLKPVTTRAKSLARRKAVREGGRVEASKLGTREYFDYTRPELEELIADETFDDGTLTDEGKLMVAELARRAVNGRRK